MRRVLLAGAAGLLASLFAIGNASAQANPGPWMPSPKVTHRTYNLKTLLKMQNLILTPTMGFKVTVRAPRNTKLSKQMGGSTNHFVPVVGRLNKAKTAKLFDVGLGHYYANPQNKQFNVSPSCILLPR